VEEVPLGRYELVSVIGEGGVGTVCLRPTSSRVVASGFAERPHRCPLDRSASEEPTPHCHGRRSS
jgi:hypothetical protein